MNDEASTLSALTLEELLNTAAHDIRASLAVMSGAVSELSAPDFGDLSQAQKQLLGLIKRGSDRLGRLAANLMYFAECREGHIVLRPSRVEVKALAGAIVEEARKLAQGRALEVSVQASAESIDFVADAERFRHALTNIVENAVLAARRSVRVEIEISGAELTVIVEDDGPRPLRKRREDVAGHVGAKKISSAELAMAVSEGLAQHLGGTLDARELEDNGKPVGVRVTLNVPRQVN